MLDAGDDGPGLHSTVVPRHHTVVTSRPGRMVWNGNALAGMGWNTLTGFMVK